jgi:hypothetical protein
MTHHRWLSWVRMLRTYGCPPRTPPWEDLRIPEMSPNRHQQPTLARSSRQLLSSLAASRPGCALCTCQNLTAEVSCSAPGRLDRTSRSDARVNAK